jgi:hypothetical protein
VTITATSVSQTQARSPIRRTSPRPGEQPRTSKTAAPAGRKAAVPSMSYEKMTGFLFLCAQIASSGWPLVRADCNGRRLHGIHG